MSAALATRQRTTRPFLMVYHDFLEEAMTLLSGDGFKLALFFYRETVGRGESQVTISYTRLQEKTGIKRRPALAKALKEVLSLGLVRIGELVGLRGTKTYSMGEWVTSSPVEPVVGNTWPRTSSPVEPVTKVIPLTSSPVEPVLVHQLNQNQFTMRTSTGSPVELVAPCQPAPEEAPRVPKETYRNVIINDKENVGGSLVPAVYYQQIEEQREDVKYVEDELRKALEEVQSLSPLAKERPEAQRKARLYEHEVTKQREKLAMYELTVGFMEQDYPPQVAAEKAKALVREQAPGRKGA